MLAFFVAAKTPEHCSIAMASVGQRRCVAIYDYNARDNEELTIHKDDHLTVIDDMGSWWTVRNKEGQSGLVPSNYVNETRSTVEEPAHMYQQTDLMVNQRNGPALNIRAIAKFKYVGSREDELSLEKGDEVIVVEKEADGWWRGRCGTRIGWFPFNYVEETEDGPSADVAAPPQQPAPSSPPEPSGKAFICGVIALYSFNSGNPEELVFQKGDLLDITDQPPDDPDWWEARASSGTTGLVPRNYVEVLHDAEPVSSGGGGGRLGFNTSGSASPAGAAVSQLPPFGHEPWFHGKMARREAEALLNSYAENGQFVVRASETKVSLLFLFLTHAHTHTHTCTHTPTHTHSHSLETSPLA